MRIEDFIWLEDIVEKLQVKHAVEQHEVVEALTNRPLHHRFMEKGHREGEDLYLALGRTDSGRYLAVFFVLKQKNTALVISARTMMPHERKQYERR